MSNYSIVILVDLKVRDQLGVSLIAHHLEDLGIKAHLEPLESWRSCINAWKPDMIIFNHLLHSHITDLSEKLHQWGILVGCLLNEGLALNDSARTYLSEPQFPNVHCDLFLTWNKVHQECLREAKLVTPPENAIAIGVPRFDFYHQPWSNYYLKPKKTTRTRILLNTTFALSHFFKESPEKRKSLYVSLGNGKIPVAIDYNKMIDDHYHSRDRLIDYLKPLLDSQNYDITLRPHPREDTVFYKDLIASLPADQQKLITLDPNAPVFSAILNSDIVLNCEDCTTSVESWIAKKPTLTLTFTKNPAFFTELYATCSPQVSEPSALIQAITRDLETPEQPDYQAQRKSYLEKWLFKTDGQSAFRAAQEINRVLKEKAPTPKVPFSFSGTRRGLKVKLFQAIDEPGHTKLRFIIKKALFKERGKMSLRYRDYIKAIKPSEVRKTRQLLRSISVKSNTKSILGPTDHQPTDRSSGTDTTS